MLHPFGGQSRHCCLPVALSLALVGAATATDPASAYRLALPPLTIYDRLPDLKVGDVPALSADERKVLQRGWDLKATRKAATIPNELLLEALLWASAIEDADKRAKYRERFEKLVNDARVTVARSKDARDRGEKLMGFLHAGVMKNGYAEDQSSFAAVFDTGKFNCVSSSALYYAVGSRLDLDLRPFSIPGGVVAGHAALDLIDGKARVQVEPTNPDGFDWQAKVSRPGVRVIGFVPDRSKGHQVDALGLPAMIYSNRGVALTKSKGGSPLAAARCYVSALALDPTDGTAANNLVSVFVNWGPELADQKKFAEALRVLALGQAVQPKDRKVRNNHAVVWETYILALLAEKRDAEAVAAVAKAGTALPDKADFRDPGKWFQRHGDRHVKAREWEAAIGVVERGLMVLSPEQCRSLKAWRSDVFRWWSQVLLDEKDCDGSLKVLARAYALDPTDRAVIDGIGFHTHESLATIEAKDGREKMAAHFRVLRDQFPRVEVVIRNGRAHAGQSVQTLVEQKKFAEAVAAVKQYEPLLGTPADRAAVGAVAYDGWARSLAAKKEWKPALDKYAEGLKAYPGNQLLKNNLGVTVDKWAERAVGKMEWAEAARIYRLGLNYLPGEARLKRNAEVFERKK
jgi:tetratricopeptide (TPR) repeat protein